VRKRRRSQVIAARHRRPDGREDCRVSSLDLRVAEPQSAQTQCRARGIPATILFEIGSGRVEFGAVHLDDQPCADHHVDASYATNGDLLPDHDSRSHEIEEEQGLAAAFAGSARPR
jgi:hypothetical protein